MMRCDGRGDMMENENGGGGGGALNIDEESSSLCVAVCWVY